MVRKTRRRRKPLGRCRRCGRLLYNPVSARKGIGPECEKKERIQHRIRVKITRPKPPTSAFSKKKAYDEINNSIADGLLEGAIVYGISYAFPPLGAFLLPSYDALKLSHTLLNASHQIMRAKQNNRRRIARERVPRVAGELTSFIASEGSYAVASSIIDYSLGSLGIKSGVGAEILKGTLGNGLAEGAGGLASYTVGTIVGV